MIVTVKPHPQDSKRIQALTIQTETFEEERIATALLTAIQAGKFELSYPISDELDRTLSFEFEQTRLK